MGAGEAWKRARRFQRVPFAAGIVKAGYCVCIGVMVPPETTAGVSGHPFLGSLLDWGTPISHMVTISLSNMDLLVIKSTVPDSTQRPGRNLYSEQIVYESHLHPKKLVF